MSNKRDKISNYNLSYLNLLEASNELSGFVNGLSNNDIFAFTEDETLKQNISEISTIGPKETDDEKFINEIAVNILDRTAGSYYMKDITGGAVSNFIKQTGEYIDIVNKDLNSLPQGNINNFIDSFFSYKEKETSPVTYVSMSEMLTYETYKDNQFCGVFKTDNYIIRVDNNADQFKCELNIMFALGKGLIKNHNIVLPIYVKIDTRTRRKSSLHFSIQPRIKNCETLQDWLSRFENKCKQTEYFISMCIKCCKMVQNLHKHHLVHGDIKPDNILIDLSNDEMYLIDFGLSGLHKLSEGTGGTKPYCSPLSLNANLNEKYIWTKNSKYNDVWSIALIFLCIIIFKRVFSYYCHFPTYFFNDDFYVSSYYLNKIPSHYRTPFELVLTKNNISIETFIYLLENSLITKKNCFII